MINDVYDCNETACGIQGATKVSDKVKGNFIESVKA